MRGYLFLALAVVCEVSATLSLRAATHGRRRWYAAVVTGYLAAFTCLSLTLSSGIGLGVAYGVWAAAGVALTAVLSRVLFGEVLNRTTVLGILLIVGGVLLVEAGSGS
ncbi:SMR family transporter [Paenibacillus sp. TRM 82003]|uniref:DMT family transporter n=1 Tax=Kineococcus sp. TRM81007 TaxID=2925831 RepID=UPI001F56DDEE|nr:SMR family transporter [Kineococcus sp. TRM81007]MCI2239423.1 SMR family transporter [Kineococcus sp. TRM81007]MCI3918793.1 SMR family transporter [Paenibacillus sp. TRM 82003]